MSLLLAALALAVLITTGALVMTLVNLRVYRPAPAPSPEQAGTLVSVCVPARNEEANIEACVRSLLASTHHHLEVLVYDDHSTDQTPQILARLAAEDARVRPAVVSPLPTGWNGKQFACNAMGRQAAGEWLLFTDADVRFEPGCVAAALAAAGDLRADLVSTFPRQRTGSWAEHAIVPLIFFILFSYLPMPRMRRTGDPAASAGCGQFLFARRDAYAAAGGHAAFADSMHDGIKMPRAFRAKGFRTDLFDATNLCSVRMYAGLPATWRGFTKNAFEGLGSLGLLVFVTFLHLIGHILPFAVLLAALTPLRPAPLELFAALAAVLIALAQRTLLARRFAHHPLTIPLHPVGVALMTIIQWRSYYLHRTGRRAWRGRTLAPASS